MSTGQVATTIIVAQITAPSSGCTMKSEEINRKRMATTAIVVRGSSRLGVVMIAPCGSQG